MVWFRVKTISNHKKVEQAMDPNIRKQLLVGVLLGVNVVLLCVSIVLLSNQALQKESIPVHLVSAGTDVSSLFTLEKNSFSYLGQINAKNIVFVFFNDSVFHRASEFLDHFVQCASRFSYRAVAMVIVCRSNTTCLGASSAGLSSKARNFELVFFQDDGEELRRRFGITKVGTVMIDTRTRIVKQSYPYVLNPYVLCEQLQLL